MANVRTIKGLWLGIFSLALLWGCAAKNAGPTLDGGVPANMRTFRQPFAQVWGALTKTIQYDYLLPIEVIDEQRGYFTTELVRDYQPFAKSKYRLSGTVAFDGKVSIVKLYRDTQILKGKEWKTIPSDLRLEKKILDDLSKKLGSN